MEKNYSWVATGSSLCYKSDNGSQFCGRKGDCTGLVLPLVFEEAWSTELRAFLYLFGLLYRYYLCVCITESLVKQSHETIRISFTAALLLAARQVILIFEFLVV